MTTAVAPVRALTAGELSELPRSRPHQWGRWILAALLLLLLVSAIVGLAQNRNLNWGVVAQYLTAERILAGLGMTIVLSVIGMVIGIVFGALLAVARMSGNPVISAAAGAYVWFFRGVPLLVQMLIWGNFALLVPMLKLGIPFTSITFLSASTNSVITTFVAACLALGLHEAAYMAEVTRSGILSVGSGQREASLALGMTDSLGLRRILLPQAIRVIIPPTGNQFISLIKASSMVSVIAGGDLLTAAQDIASVNYRTIELLLVATAWYLVVVTVLNIGQHFLERRFARGTKR